MKDQILKIYQNSYSRTDFENKLHQENIQVLHKNGQAVGFVDHEKQINVQFHQIGLDEEKMRRLDVIELKVQHNVQRRLKRVENHLGLEKLRSKNEQEKGQSKDEPSK